MVQNPDAVWAVIVATLMDGNLRALFPDEERPIAVRAKETRLGFTEAVVDLKKMAANFAA